MSGLLNLKETLKARIFEQSRAAILEMDASVAYDSRVFDETPEDKTPSQIPEGEEVVSDSRVFDETPEDKNPAKIPEGEEASSDSREFDEIPQDKNPSQIPEGEIVHPAGTNPEKVVDAEEYNETPEDKNPEKLPKIIEGVCRRLIADSKKKLNEDAVADVRKHETKATDAYNTDYNLFLKHTSLYHHALSHTVTDAKRVAKHKNWRDSFGKDYTKTTGKKIEFPQYGKKLSEENKPRPVVTLEEMRLAAAKSTLVEEASLSFDHHGEMEQHALAVKSLKGHAQTPDRDAVMRSHAKAFLAHKDCVGDGGCPIKASIASAHAWDKQTHYHAGNSVTEGVSTVNPVQQQTIHAQKILENDQYDLSDAQRQVNYAHMEAYIAHRDAAEGHGLFEDAARLSATAKALQESYSEANGDISVRELFESAESDESYEIRTFADNHHKLYNQKMSVVKNLKKRMDKGTYDHKQAPKAWMNVINNAHREYKREFKHPGFSVAARQQAAHIMANHYHDEIKLGNYDD